MPVLLVLFDVVTMVIVFLTCTHGMWHPVRRRKSDVPIWKSRAWMRTSRSNSDLVEQGGRWVWKREKIEYFLGWWWLKT